ncbi:ABC transporter permease [Dyella tabacisoli]|uniref:ABC transporter permease n=1 Tax=Dyella tabacisoli TaxID=2282381 RepID=A0A369UNS4_9GAMM|nr:ABC transporter permease [Dyella tabacisoli]RDD81368.1 ABC transporter permease [Dyella tabacisoli]
MIGYYINLAGRSLRSHKVLTALMVMTLGLGIGACITTLTVLKLLSGDPLPEKNGQLFYPQVDPFPADRLAAAHNKPPPIMTYTDAMNLVSARKARHQAAVALVSAKVMPQGTGAQALTQRPFFSDGVIATADFFSMFDVPFKYGSGWSAADDQNRAPVAVIADTLNNRLFGGGDSIGRTIRINDRDFRIVGVTKAWAPQPRFYAQELGGRSYGDGDGVFVPLGSALAAGMSPQQVNCFADSDVSKLETASCTWLGVWVELGTPDEVTAYRDFLGNYAQQQISLGRFHRSTIALTELGQWLRDKHVVPDDVRLQTWLAFGFLLVCVVNAVGLLLAKCLRRSNEIGVRRALGATWREIFTQFMVEAGMVGLVGGLMGLVFTELGLWCIRNQPAQYAGLAHLDLEMFLVTFFFSAAVGLIAGVLPAWRACVVSPAPQLKAA